MSISSDAANNKLVGPHGPANVCPTKVWYLAKKIHEAKIKCCWPKEKWDQRFKIEPWDKPNRASPNQPWHDIAIAQAEAVLEEINAGRI